MGASTVSFEVSGSVAWIRLNRPERRNALSYDVLDDLLEICELVAVSDITRAVVLTGTGSAFCAGGDLNTLLATAESPESSPPHGDQVRRLIRWHRIATLLHDMPKPTLAAINGAVVGGGVGLALSCDVRVMKQSATMRCAFPGMAASGDFGASWFLTRLAGWGRARDFFLLDQTLSADDAFRAGIASLVVSDREFDVAVAGLAERLSQGPTHVYALMKANLGLAETEGLQVVLDQEAESMIRSLRTAEHAEAARAFLEKRPPRFEGAGAAEAPA